MRCKKKVGRGLGGQEDGLGGDGEVDRWGGLFRNWEKGTLILPRKKTTKGEKRYETCRH